MRCISQVIPFRQIEDAKDPAGKMVEFLTQLRGNLVSLGVKEAVIFTKIWAGVGGLIVEVYGE